MADNGMHPPTGIFEGYLKKRKNNSALHLISDTNKRYFYLDLSTYSMVYYKNRKKSGKPSPIPIRGVFSLHRIDDDTTHVIAGKEWAYMFVLMTRERVYELKAYSWNDREVWIKGLSKHKINFPYLIRIYFEITKYYH